MVARGGYMRLSERILTAPQSLVRQSARGLEFFPPGSEGSVVCWVGVVAGEQGGGLEGQEDGNRQERSIRRSPSPEPREKMRHILESNDLGGLRLEKSEEVVTCVEEEADRFYSVKQHTFEPASDEEKESEQVEEPEEEPERRGVLNIERAATACFLLTAPASFDVPPCFEIPTRTQGRALMELLKQCIRMVPTTVTMRNSWCRTLSLTCAALWRIATSNSEVGRELAQEGGSELACMLARVVNSAWLQLPHDGSAKTWHSQNNESGVEEHLKNQHSVMAYSLGTLWFMAYHDIGVAGIIGSEADRREAFLHGAKMPAGEFPHMGIWAIEVLAHMLQHTGGNTTACYLTAAALHTVALQAPAQRRTLVSLGIGISAEDIVRMEDAPMAVRTICANLALALLDLDEKPPPTEPPSSSKPGTHSSASDKRDAPSMEYVNRLNFFRAPLDWQGPEDTHGPGYAERVGYLEKNSMSRLRWGVAMAAALCECPVAELQQAGGRACAILASRDQYRQDLGEFGLVYPLKALLQLKPQGEGAAQVARARCLGCLALYNLSANRENQLLLARHCLSELLLIMQSPDVVPGEAGMAPDQATAALANEYNEEARRAAAGTLHNIMRHAKNRTELHKAEIDVRTAQLASLKQMATGPLPQSLDSLVTHRRAPRATVSASTSVQGEGPALEPETTESSIHWTGSQTDRLGAPRMNMSLMESFRVKADGSLDSGGALSARSPSTSSRQAPAPTFPILQCGNWRRRAPHSLEPEKEMPVPRTVGGMGSLLQKGVEPTLTQVLRRPLRAMWGMTSAGKDRIQCAPNPGPAVDPLPARWSAYADDPPTTVAHHRAGTATTETRRRENEYMHNTNGLEMWRGMVPPTSSNLPLEASEGISASMTSIHSEAGRDAYSAAQGRMAPSAPEVSSRGTVAPSAGGRRLVPPLKIGNTATSASAGEASRASSVETAEMEGTTLLPVAKYQLDDMTSRKQFVRAYKIQYEPVNPPSRHSTKVQVSLVPKPPKSLVRAQDRSAIAGNTQTSRPDVFIHKPGCSVCEGLFRHYRLQNGLLVHCFHQYLKLAPPVPVFWEYLDPPIRLSQLDQMCLPSPEVCWRPPDAWLADWYQSAPRTPAGGPPVRILKIPLENPRLELVLEYTNPVEADIVETQSEIENDEDCEFEWLKRSIFAPRAKTESESKAFFDKPMVFSKAVARDWQRALLRPQLCTLMGGEEQGVQSAVLMNFDLIRLVYEYYASLGVGSVGNGEFHMDLNEWRMFVQECDIMDHKHCTKQALDRLFEKINRDAPNAKPTSINADNPNRALTRFEFIHGLVGLAELKLIVPGDCQSLAEAVDMLCTHYISINLAAEASCDPNEYRRDRLYDVDVDEVFCEHKVLLRACFDGYCGRLRRLGLPGWISFLRETGLMEQEVAGLTRREACLCFLWSRPAVSDELQDKERVQRISFVDFLEALARVTDTISPPSTEELREWGAKGDEPLYEYFMRVERSHSAASVMIRRHNSSGLLSPKTRPLAEKLEQVIGVIKGTLISELHCKDETDLVKVLRAAKEAGTRPSALGI
ncbi:hypothetical protein CYMTET_18185 [Cymbomonas tetramitiformis]|uniref:Uncharacterized protein n=1 Tax=Cymbomonas tetramitiformis TaxID=36881 RepID=A0AAE0G968_9CHLO|nr:hypothetical protein CYMTET_18185 [Cymbomonas tetramitiformis]